MCGKRTTPRLWQNRPEAASGAARSPLGLGNHFFFRRSGLPDSQPSPRVLAHTNAKYGRDPVVMFYSHLSDRYAPFSTRAISSTVRDATYVLDGLVDQGADLPIEEHYTDTAGLPTIFLRSAICWVSASRHAFGTSPTNGCTPFTTRNSMVPCR